MKKQPPDGGDQSKKKEEGQSRAQVIRELLESLEERVSKGEVKGTLGDYIRLIQLQRELEADEPRDIRVTWIDKD